MKSNSKKIIILGGGSEQAPAIQIAKTLKITCIVFDKNKYAIGRKISDYFFLIA